MRCIRSEVGIELYLSNQGVSAAEREYRMVEKDIEGSNEVGGGQTGRKKMGTDI